MIGRSSKRSSWRTRVHLESIHAAAISISSSMISGCTSAKRRWLNPILGGDHLHAMALQKPRRYACALVIESDRDHAQPSSARLPLGQRTIPLGGPDACMTQRLPAPRPSLRADQESTPRGRHREWSPGNPRHYRKTAYQGLSPCVIFRGSRPAHLLPERLSRVMRHHEPRNHRQRQWCAAQRALFARSLSQDQPR